MYLELDPPVTVVHLPYIVAPKGILGVPTAKTWLPEPFIAVSDPALALCEAVVPIDWTSPEACTRDENAVSACSDVIATINIPSGGVSTAVADPNIEPICPKP